MTVRSSRPRPAARSFARRLGVAAGVTGAALAIASPVQAAQTDISFGISVYPTDIYTDGVTPPAPTDVFDGGSYGGSYRVNYGPAPGPTRVDVQQIRGGAVLPDPYNIDTGVQTAVTVLPGDVFRLIDLDTGGALAETAFNGLPAVSSSALGQSAVAGLLNPGTTSVSIDLARRVARQARKTWVSGTFVWVDRALPTPTSPEYDETAAKDFSSDSYPVDYPYNEDTIPARPAPPVAGRQWYLQTVTPGAWTVVPESRFESVAVGRIASFNDSSFTGVFSAPLAAGDYVTVRAASESIAGDVTTSISTSVTAPAGVRDAILPKLVGIQFGARSTTFERYLKTGLRAFVTIDEPGTVTQVIQYTPKSKKKSKPKQPKFIGTGTATITAGGQAAQIDIKADKKGKKNLKAFRKLKKGKLTLVTTIIDTAGNISYAQQPIKLKK